MNIFIVLARQAPVNFSDHQAADLSGSDPNPATFEEEFPPVYTQNDDGCIIRLDDMRVTWPQFFTPAPAPRGCHAIAEGLGRQDARDGLACVPEMFFTQRTLQAYYCRGYASINGHTETTRFFVREEIA